MLIHIPYYQKRVPPSIFASPHTPWRGMSAQAVWLPWQLEQINARKPLTHISKPIHAYPPPGIKPRTRSATPDALLRQLRKFARAPAKFSP